MVTNARVTVRLPKSLEIDFLKRVISDGYGMKGKSKWAYEAIKYFMQLPDFEEYVEYASDFVGFEQSTQKGETKIQALYFDVGLVRDMNDAVIQVRKKYPHLEGIRSLIIRASIIQRLFRKKEVYISSHCSV